MSVCKRQAGSCVACVAGIRATVSTAVNTSCETGGGGEELTATKTNQRLKTSSIHYPRTMSSLQCRITRFFVFFRAIFSPFQVPIDMAPRRILY